MIPSLEVWPTKAKEAPLQVHKDILSVWQHCTDIEFKPFLVLLNHILSFFPQVVGLWNSLPKDITNIQNKTNFSKNVEIL